MTYADNIIPQVKDTFFEWCFSWKKDWWEWSPFSSYITLLSEKLHTPPMELLNNYTTSQLERLTEWIIRNANETTKDWQRKNRLESMKQKALTRTPEEQAKIDNILKSMK
jgi:hypothetical protein